MYESNTGLSVSNHYGPRNVGGEKGSHTTQDGRRIYTIDVPEANLLSDTIIQEGALVENVETFGTASVSALTVGSVDISAATWGAGVSVTATGELNGTFTGEGKVVITVTDVAY